MRAETRNRVLLAKVIDVALRCSAGPVRVTDLAREAGFSRFHLGRLFQESTGEKLEGFLRRIRHERAAYLLLNTCQSIVEIASACGYQSPEAFTRSFKTAFGQTPRAYRRLHLSWKLDSPKDLHWNPDWIEPDLGPRLYEEAIRLMPTRIAFVRRYIRNYSYLPETWEALQADAGGLIPTDVKFLTVYLDNMWTHPDCDMRADVGWFARDGEKRPRGMKQITIPGGRYIVSKEIERSGRNDAWSYMAGRYCSRDPQSWAYDEYSTWPLPFENSQTTIFVGT